MRFNENEIPCKPGTLATKPLDAGATDANIGVSFGKASVVVGAVRYKGPHTLEEAAEADSLVPGVKMLIAFSVSSAGLAQ